MIEQSANGVLFEEFDRLHELNEAIVAGHSPYGQRRPVIVHVVKPRHPLPLDPDFFMGRIDAATLIAMGYGDARRYLGTADREDGVPLTPAATRMEEPGVRVSWRESHTGPLGQTELAAEIPDAAAFLAGPRREARLVGRVRGPATGDALLRDGRVALEAGALLYEGTFEAGGREVRLRGRREAPAGKPLRERLSSLRHLHLELRESESKTILGAGRLDPHGARTTPLPIPIVTDAPSTWRRLTTAAAFERVMATELL